MPFEGTDYVINAIVDNASFSHVLMYTMSYILQFIILRLFFRIRRFRSGFPFLYKGYSIIIALIATGAVLVFTTLGRTVAEGEDAYIAYIYLAGLLIISVGIIIWIRRGITLFQWQRTMLRNKELLEEALAAEKEKSERLEEKILALQTANHQVIHRMEAMEYAIARQAAGAELDEEAVSLDDVRKLQNEYQETISQIKARNTLPSVKMKGLDNLFGYYAERFSERGIDFKLAVSGSILYMTEHIIPQEKLETMVGDHLQDALAAINESDNPHRAVLAKIGLAGDCYEFSVSDSGVPFEVDTLVRLGAERVTTHQEDGGSGIGFMTTFETMKECGASLIISEKPPSAADYTKTVTVRFDNQNRYVIKTYRPDDFPVNDRYIVEPRQ